MSPSFRRLLPLFLLPCLASAQSDFVRQRFAEAPKPAVGTVGLVLSGGAQFGWAHVGVIRWLEDHHVPVHCVTGTSMGALMGGMYSVGISPEEVEQFAGSVDWDRIMLNEPEYDRLTFRRKQDRRDVPSILELGVHQGISAPLGLSSAPAIGVLFSRAALPYDEETDFDKLMLPFRCVSFDYARLKRYVPRGGSLPLALRSSMAIPIGFSPAVSQNRVLGDGGVLENLPVGTAIDTFHPDAIIAVNVQADVDIDKPDVDTEPIHHPDGKAIRPNPNRFDVAAQGAAVLFGVGAQQTREAKKMLAAMGERGVYIAPDVLTTNRGWGEYAWFIRKGWEAAEKLEPKLRKFELNDADWQAYIAWREAMRRPRTYEPQGVQAVVASVSGGRSMDAETLLQRQFRPFVGKTLDATDYARPSRTTRRFEGSVANSLGTGRYQSLTYEASPNGRDISLYALPKPYGPSLLYLSPSLAAGEWLQTNASLKARAVRFDPFGYGSEMRLDFELGFRNSLGLELMKPIGADGLFAALRSYGAMSPQDVYAGTDRVGTMRHENAGLGIDLGYAIDRHSELRAGFDVGTARTVRSVGDPGLATYSGPENSFSLRFSHDGQDNAMLPTRGVRLDATGRLFTQVPTGERNLRQAEGYGSAFIPVGHGSAFLLGGGGTLFGEQSYAEQFSLGGLMHLSALRPGELFGGSYAIGGLGYMVQVGKLPIGIGAGNIRLGAWTEYAKVELFDGTYREGLSVSGGAFAESPFGPLFLGVSHNAHDLARVQFVLGRLF